MGISIWLNSVKGNNTFQKGASLTFAIILGVLKMSLIFLSLQSTLHCDGTHSAGGSQPDHWKELRADKGRAQPCRRLHRGGEGADQEGERVGSRVT